MFELRHSHQKSDSIISVELIGTYPNTNKEIDKIYHSMRAWQDIYKTDLFLVDYFKVDYSPSPQQMTKNTQRIIDNNLTEAIFVILFDTKSESYARYKLFLAKAESNRVINNITQNIGYLRTEWKL